MPSDEPLLHLGADGKILDPRTTAPRPLACIVCALSSQDEANLIAQMLLEERIYGNHPTASPSSSCVTARTWHASAACSPRTVFPLRGPPRRSCRCDDTAIAPSSTLQPARLRPQARREGTQPAVHMPAAEGAEGSEAADVEAKNPQRHPKLKSSAPKPRRRHRREKPRQPLGGAQSITLLTSRPDGASSMDVRRLRQQLRSIELQSGATAQRRPAPRRPATPETLPEEGVGRADAPHRSRALRRT